MANTYLNLTNELLRRLNEVEIPFHGVSSQLVTDTIGIQRLAADAVQASIDKINMGEYEWPFNAQEGTIVGTENQFNWAFPDTLKVPDWNSFHVHKKNGQSSETRSKLSFIDADTWYESHRDDDLSGKRRGLPVFVYPTHGHGFGVTPVLDGSYDILYNYYETPKMLKLVGDETRIPATFKNVIIDGALYHMYMFKENSESAELSLRRFEKGIKEMQSILINKYDMVRDLRVNYARRY